MQLAGRDTLTSISAEVCRATYIHTLPDLFPQQGRHKAVYLTISLGEGSPSRGGGRMAVRVRTLESSESDPKQ